MLLKSEAWMVNSDCLIGNKQVLQLTDTLQRNIGKNAKTFTRICYLCIRETAEIKASREKAAAQRKE